MWLARNTVATDPTKEAAMSETFHLRQLADETLRAARGASAGRAARKLWGGPDTAMTQTVIAITEGNTLHEHENPGEATVHVLTGQVQLQAGAVAIDGQAGDLLAVPDARHSLYAVSDAVVLLTAVKVHAGNLD